MDNAGDVRKPFYDYSRGVRGISHAASWRFADWAAEFMYDMTPERAFTAYIRARDGLTGVAGKH